MQKKLNENTEITSLFHLTVLQRTKLVSHFGALGDLLKFSTNELLELNGITVFDVACIVDMLNKFGYHLIGEENIKLTYYYYDEKSFNLLKRCDELVRQRDKIREKNKEFFSVEDHKLTETINSLLEQVANRYKKDNEYFNVQR